MPSVFGSRTSWPANCPASCRSWASSTRVTNKPAAVDTISAGIWPARPSPMVRIVYDFSASVIAISCCTTPIATPPSTLTSVITMPAMASPRTNLLAPSIAP